MSLLTKNTTPAERQRGCVFSEKFENTQAVVQNGVTTINGTPTINNGGTFDGTNDYLSYAEPALSLEQDGNPISISVDFDVTINRGALQVITEFSPGLTANDSGMILIDTSNQVRFYYDNGAAIFTSAALTAGRHTVTMTWNGSSQRLGYLDGVALSGSTSGAGGITSLGTAIGARIDGTLKMQGTIYSVKYFNKVLTLQEALDIHNKNVYDYINDAVLDLPMDMERHDPTNTQTLDVSGNGNNGAFKGAGEPAKNSDDMGYLFDGSDDYLALNNGDPIYRNTGYSISLWFKNTDLTQRDGRLYAEGSSSNNNPLFNIMIGESGSENKLRYEIRNDANSTLLSLHGNTILTQNNWYNVVWTDSNGTAKAYINGVLDTRDLDYTPSGTLTFNRSSIGTLTRASSSFYFNGSIAKVKLWKKQLTPLQIADLYQRELKQINDI